MRSSTLRRRVSLGTAAAALGIGLTALSAHPAAAQTTVYDNTVNYSGSAYAAGGVTSATGSTLMVADDINPLAGSAGLAVTQFSFSITNFNATAVSAASTVYFYGSDGANGGPGTLLNAFRFSFSSLGVGTGVYSYNPTAGATLFTMPTGTMWAGMSFSDGTSGTATVAQLDNLGQGIFTTPVVGSSQDAFFQSTNPATVTSNPVGGFSNFGASTGAGPLANFGWSFRTAPVPAPEASTTVSLGLMLALGMGGLVIAAKRKKASAQA